MSCPPLDQEIAKLPFESIATDGLLWAFVVYSFARNV